MSLLYSGDGFKMELTIGITCFNAEDSIARAIGSCVELGLDYEILVVDDCSSDASATIVTDIVRKSSGRVRLVCHDVNKGVAAARNSLIREAKGRYLAFLDDDDEWVPGRYRRQYDLITMTSEASGRPVLCYGARERVGLDGSVKIISGVGSRQPVGAPDVGYYFLAGLKDKQPFGLAGTGTMMAESVLLRELGGFDENFRRCEDTDLIIRHAKRGGVSVSVPDPVIRQNVTLTEDKIGGLDNKYQMALIEKHIADLGRFADYAIWRCRRSLAKKQNRRWMALYCKIRSAMSKVLV